MSGKLALVTGVTGFIGGHVALALLAEGYRVRGTARGTKAKALTETTKIPGLEFVQIDDLATGDYTDALKDVDVVVHVASPLPGRGSSDSIIDGAIRGTVNLLNQAAKAGIEKIVVTGSVAATRNPEKEHLPGTRIVDSNWGEVDSETLARNKDNAFFVYRASKILAEKAVWEFAKEHPKVDIATILPGFVYGPYAPGLPLPTSADGLGTNEFFYKVMQGLPMPQYAPSFVDVRDVAKAHVRALDVPRKPLGQKRYLVVAGNYTWKQVAAVLNKRRPELKTLKQEEFTDFAEEQAWVDAAGARQDLGLVEYVEFEKTVEDTVDSLLEVARSW